MINLKPLDLANLKLLLAGKTIATKAQIDTLNILRSEMPDLFSGLTKEQLADNRFLTKYLSNPYNRNKIRDALKKELSTPQQVELIQVLEEEPATTKGVIYQQGQSQTGQEAPLPAGSSGGGMPKMPSMSAPAIHPIFRTKPPIVETPKPDIAIANKSGYVAEASPTQFHVTDKAGNIQATYSREPAPVATQPKLVLARSDGSIIQSAAKKPTIHIADKSGNIVKTYNIKSPGWLKTFGSNAQIFAKKNLGRIANGLTRSALPSGANFLGRSGLGFINQGGNFLGRLSNVRSRFSTAASSASPKNLGSKKWALGLLGGFMLITLLGGMLGGIGGTAPTTDAAPIGGTTPPIGMPADIASCKFSRAELEAKFKSNTLLSFIQEASQKSSIPPVVLAAFIRVESPTSSDMSDTQIANYAADCAVSPTKALGIMQIQPPGTTSLRGDPASCDDCIDAGAKLVGKTVSTMTRDDYCDPRTSIIVGAGWILKKMSYSGYGDGTKWDPAWTNDSKAIEALANTYYGCLNYGGIQDCTGPFNYADDVSTSIKNCQTTQPVQPGTRPTAPIIDPAQLQISLISQFGITMDGFDENHLRWAWEKLWDVSNTKFVNLVRGSVVRLTSTSDTAQVGCPGDPVGVYLGQFDEVLFKYGLIHELGHIIRNCSKTSSSFYESHYDAYTKEGGVTYYANNAASCTGSDNPSEDYAEMIALYLNPNANIQMVKCAPAGTSYTSLIKDFPMHYDIARAVLGAY